jgi:hypothetical protein
MSRDEFCAANRRNWDERVAIHRRDTTRFYAVERFLAGEKWREPAGSDLLPVPDINSLEAMCPIKSAPSHGFSLHIRLDQGTRSTPQPAL